MKEMVEMPRVSDNRKCLDSELRVIMPSVLLPAAPKFKWGDFDEEDADAVGTNGNVAIGKDHSDLEHGEQGQQRQEREQEQEKEEQEQAQQPQPQPQQKHEEYDHNADNSGTQFVEDYAASPSSSGTTIPAAAGTGENPSLDIANLLMKRFTGGSLGESKERFRQRLWCYLFENLNRAIDELYFLCELECDMEQIQEALLVFNEAGLDFRELKARVENFDTLKKASGKSVDNDSAKLEQRPHAIAWEVRRMASSPRRADILSLSLEAFKKVQLGGNKQESMHQTKRRDAARFLSFEQAMKQKPEAEISTSTSNTQIKPAIMTDDHQNQKQTMPCCHPGPNGATDASSPPPDTSACSGEPPPPPIHPTEETRKCEEEEEEEDRDDLKSTSSTCDKKPSTKTGLEAWKEKRNWEDILSSPLSSASRASGSPAVVGRKSTERGRVLHDKLMSPERKKKTPMEMKKEVDEKQARATRIRRELENERALRLQRTTEKLNRVSEWQAVRSSKLREGMHARQQRGESRHEAHLAQIARRASDESSKVSEVRFITSLNEENKKLSLQQKLQDSELRRAERLQNLRIKQKEDVAREEAALERRKLLEAERLQRIAETQRKKEEAQARREEERKAANAAREARAVEQVRKKEVRAKAQEEEVELLRQKLAERLRESALRRKIYLEQIRERAVMDAREQGSPLSRRPSSREGQSRIIGGQNNEAEMVSEREMSTGRLVKMSPNAANAPDGNHQALKKRIKKIRQRLTTRRFDYAESDAAIPVTPATRTKLGRWVQELQRLQQARKAGASAIVLIIAEIIKYLDGKDIELHVARHTGLLDFIAAAVPASHTSKPEASQTTVALLKVLVVLLSLPANRSYFLARNLLPPLIPILSTALENYSSVGCSVSGTVKEEKVVADEKFDAVGEVLEDLLKCVTLVMGHTSTDERQQQMQDDLVELIVACDVIHRLRNLFALFDRPQIEGAPFPPPVLLGLKLLDTLTRGKTVATSLSSSMAAQFLKSIPVSGAAAGIKKCVDSQQEKEKLTDNSESAECNNEASESTEKLGRCCVEPESKPESRSTDNDRVSRSLFLSQDAGASDSISASNREESKRPFHTSKSVGFLLVAIAETGLIGLPSLLTAVLLQANPRASTPEQAASSLPLNFEEVATSVLRVLNNTACLDLSLVQTMLAMPDLKMEFFHLVSFLLSYCTCKWKAATDQVASLLLETLLLLGYFALLHSGNQAVLRWGKSPTILHKLCDLPFAFFSDPELTPILVGTFLAACYGSERNRDVIQQELSMELLISVLKTSKRQSDNYYNKAGVQSAEALLSKPQVRRMDVITEESEEEMQSAEDRMVVEELPACSSVTSNSSLATRRHGLKVEAPEAPAVAVAAPAAGSKAPKKPRAAGTREKQFPGVFLLENRFPSSLWENAIDFFSLR